MSIIQINDLSYIHSDREILFSNIRFSLAPRQKVALIGPNGSGKSTLLRLIAGELKPASGGIVATGKPYYIPQHFGQYDRMTLAGALGIELKVSALHAILSGDPSEGNYAALQDDWTVEERAVAALTTWGLSDFPLSQPMSELSGGEKTKVFLSGLAIHEPALILMDEPSNHLDTAAREMLYSLIENSPAAMVVVSHDRTLLNRLDTMLEIGKTGITACGGNYEFYKTQKENELRALQGRVEEREKNLRTAQKVAREAAERKQQRDARGKGKMKKEGVPRILLKTITDGAAASARKLEEVHTKKIGSISEELRSLREKIPDSREMKVKLENSGLHRGKILITARGINYSYGKKALWKTSLSFQCVSGERIAIEGGNGSGKTTLLKLILGELEPSEGTLFRADFNALYVDQEYSLIDNSLAVYEQLRQFNRRNLPEHVLKTELHRFLFPASTWDKPCSTLSGGEKMKLIFCCLLVNDATPDLFILDEPTNNLDIQSLEIVTRSLQNYRGTLLVISHDRYFTHEIGIERVISL